MTKRAIHVVYKYTDEGHAPIARFISREYAERFAADERERQSEVGATFDVEEE